MEAEAYVFNGVSRKIFRFKNNFADFVLPAGQCVDCVPGLQLLGTDL